MINIMHLAPHRDPDSPGMIVDAGSGAPAAGSWSVMARMSWRAALTEIAAPAASRAAVIDRVHGHLEDR